MKKICLIAVFVAIFGFVGCSVVDTNLVDETAFNQVYTAYEKAEKAQNSGALRAVAQEFLAITETYPASGTVDDAFFYRALALISAEKYDTDQSPESAKAELLLAKGSLNNIPQKSSIHLSSIYYHGYADYRIWGNDSLELSYRQSALSRFSELNTIAPKHDNSPGARYYLGQIYRNSSPAQLDSALIWFDRSVNDIEESSFGKSSLYWGGTCADSLQETSKAVDLYKKYLQLDPSGIYVARVIARLSLIDPSPENIDFNRAYSLYIAKNFTASTGAFESYLSSYPSGIRVDDARYYAGRSCHELADTTLLTSADRVIRYIRATEFYAKVGTSFSSYDMSRYYYGSSAYSVAKLDGSKKSYYDTAIVMYTQLLKANESFKYRSACQTDMAFAFRNKPTPNLDSALAYFTKVDSSSTGSFWKAFTLQDLNKDSEAATQYDSYRTKFGTGFYAKAALYGSAYCRYLQGDTTTSGKVFYTESSNLFDQFIQKGDSDSLDNARLYGGHCYRKTGDRNTALIWYESGISAGDHSKQGDCTYWAGVVADLLKNIEKQKLHLNKYIVEFDNKTPSFDDPAYYADAKKRLGIL